MSIIKLNINRCWQRVFAIKLIDDFRVRSRLTEVIKSLVLRGEGNTLYAVIPFNSLLYFFDVGIAGIVLYVCRNGNLIFYRRNNIVDHGASNAKDANDQQRKENRND